MTHRHMFAAILLCLALLPLAAKMQAVTPAPDGGYAGFNTAEGQNALLNLTTGTGNTAIGWYSLESNTAGSLNTGVGSGTLVVNVGDPISGQGVQNTAVGAGALLNNTVGSYNTASGCFALVNNTEGINNTALGGQTLYNNTTGLNNTAAGALALYQNTNGYYNTATGFLALYSNTSGFENTAFGDQALLSNQGGNSNTADGYSALSSNTSGFENTGVGFQALYGSGTGNFNTAIGAEALNNITTGYNNAAIGFAAGQNLTGNDNSNIDILNAGVVGDVRVTRIGANQLKTFISGIFGTTTSGGTLVYINSDGQLGTTTSSARFKEEVKSMGAASSAIFALRPVMFRYKKDLDPAGTPQFGLVAEDVEKVNPDLVVRDTSGKPYSVRYEQVNAMLLNEFIKEHRSVQKLQAALDAVNKRVEEQEAKIQRVNDKLELSKPAPRSVANTR